MAENVDNLILVPIREMRAEMAETRAEMTREFASVRADLQGVEAKVDGVSLIVSMLAGHVHGLETRIERLEDLKDR